MVGECLMRNRLRNERKKRNLTLKQVAEIIGLTRGFYTNIELSRRNPSWKTAQRLERFFNIPASELLAETEAEETISKKDNN